MTFLADVNIPKATVDALRGVEFDVVWALEAMATEPDFEILSLAQSSNRIVLTNDKDFGELAFHAGLPSESGVILLRLSGLLPDEVVGRTMEALASRTDWAGHFSVVDRRWIRMKPLRTAL
jgi:predicted nuclease of predicted toxin-antitoxin system